MPAANKFLVVTLATPPSNPSEVEIPPSASNTTPQGILNLMTSDGKPFGFVNAEEVTAFRTALASSLLITRRRRVRTLVVFGVGKQAYWHVRLSLLIHGSTIKKIHFVNREFSERARNTLKKFIRFDEDIKENEGWASCQFDLISQGYKEIDRILKDQIRAADIIFCTTPSTAPLFDESILTNTEGRKKGRLIVAVGSYKTSMIEIPPEVIHQAVKRHGPGHHFHKHAEEGGVVVVDTLACLKETGELVGLQPNQSVELGELVMIEEMEPEPILNGEFEQSLDSLSFGDSSKGSSMSQVMREDSMESTGSTIGTTNTTSTGSSNKLPSRQSSKSSKSSHGFRKRTGSSSSQKKQEDQDQQMCRWLSTGNVIYKSVGMGLMDLVVGGDLVSLARERGVGTTVTDF